MLPTLLTMWGLVTTLQGFYFLLFFRSGAEGFRFCSHLFWTPCLPILSRSFGGLVPLRASHGRVINFYKRWCVAGNSPLFVVFLPTTADALEVLYYDPTIYCVLNSVQNLSLLLDSFSWWRLLWPSCFWHCTYEWNW